MLDAILSHAWHSGLGALQALLLPTPFFVALGLLFKGRQLATDIIRAANQARINILIHFTDALLVAPALSIIVVTLQTAYQNIGFVVVAEAFWKGLPSPVIVGAAVFLIDFIGYWRHRIEHTPLLWPAHSVHHSDTDMTWLAIFRFHPINRLTGFLIDMSFLLALGLPSYALLAAVGVKHFYGAYIHADLPWTYGPLKYIFVSPAMHRWHHAKDPVAYNTNFSTVFSFFDLVFGTFRLPGACDAPLGVDQPMGRGFLGQMSYPFKPSSYRHIFYRPARSYQPPSSFESDKKASV